MASNSIASLVLAAGLSRRFGEENKLLHEVEGEPVVARVVRAHLEAGLSPLVVLGYESELVSKALEGFPVRTLMNPDFEDGMGSSIAAGARSLDPAEIIGVSICPGDLPWLKPETIAQVVRLFAANKGQSIVFPQCGKRRGHPVFFPRSAIGELSGLIGDQGAKRIVEGDDFECAKATVADSGIYKDLDTIVENRREGYST